MSSRNSPSRIKRVSFIIEVNVMYIIVRPPLQYIFLINKVGRTREDLCKILQTDMRTYSVTEIRGKNPEKKWLSQIASFKLNLKNPWSIHSEHKAQNIIIYLATLEHWAAHIFVPQTEQFTQYKMISSQIIILEYFWRY